MWCNNSSGSEGPKPYQLYSRQQCAGAHPGNSRLPGEKVFTFETNPCFLIVRGLKKVCIIAVVFVYEGCSRHTFPQQDPSTKASQRDEFSVVLRTERWRTVGMAQIIHTKTSASQGNSGECPAAVTCTIYFTFPHRRLPKRRALISGRQRSTPAIA